MSTPHNTAKPDEVAKTVLMPGDPLRAKYIAETFLENPVQFNTVRNMFGYTGTYKGKPVSVMGSGMGMPSIGIYSYELFDVYGVENIIRIGSAGAYTEGMDLGDVMLGTHAWSESSFAFVQSGCTDKTMYPSKELNEKLKKAAEMTGIHMHEGGIHSCDVFYRHGDKSYMQEVLDNGCNACEMESFALFHNANVLNKNAACLLTMSDTLYGDDVKQMTPEERQNSFRNMMTIALEAAIMD